MRGMLLCWKALKQSRERDKIMGFSLRGIHKDELNMLLGEFPIKKEGSQGQNKNVSGSIETGAV